MRYSTGQKRRSRLQGHRKRRRVFEIKKAESEAKIGWLEYKTVRQYQSMGDMLGEFRVYGFSGGVEHIKEKGQRLINENGHSWLTE
ncbi:MAG: hypothetical protein HY954_07900 [Deltaproteobacteria bacterium]|nr:hypothetical protein [Deltaproteobacteria bacterium]